MFIFIAWGFQPHSCPGPTVVLETLPLATELDSTLLPCSPGSFLNNNIAQDTLKKTVDTEAEAVVEEVSKSQVGAVEIHTYRSCFGEMMFIYTP